MGVKLSNNADSTLATAATASDVGLTVVDGSQFPTLTSGEYFYATLYTTAGTTEIVKVTARSGNALTVTRAQDGTSASGFAAGTAVSLRVNAASVQDAVSDAVLLDDSVTTAKILDANVTTAKLANGSVTNAKLADIATNRIRGRVTAGSGDVEDLTTTQVVTALQSTGYIPVARGTVANNGTLTVPDFNNLSDVVRTGVGVADVTLNVTMSSANYSVFVSGFAVDAFAQVSSKTTTTFTITTNNSSGSPTDMDFAFLVVGTV